MKMTYNKPVVEVRNYTLKADVICGISDGDVFDPSKDQKSVLSNDEYFAG